MFTEIYTGLISSGEKELIIRPKIVPSVPKYPVLYSHGAGSGPDAMTDYGNATVRTMLVADQGQIGISSDVGGPQTWGNTAAMSSLTAKYNWLQTQPGVKTGKVILCGGSMGGLNSLVWAAANPTKVAAVSVYIPVLNPTEIHSLNLSGYAGVIDSCYPPSGWQLSLRATKDPMYMAAMGKYDGMDIRIHYGLNDVLCLPHNPPEFGALVDTAEIIGIDGGHEETTEKGIDRYAEAQFILEHAV